MSCEDQHLGNHHNHNHGHSHSHSHSHGHDDNDGHDGHEHTHIAPVPTNESQSLYTKIDTFHVTALNLANHQDDLKQLFKDAEHKYELKPVIKSDCDPQFIINIPFLNSSVKLYSIILRTNGDKYCPKTIKLWKNDKTIDFDNVETKQPHFKIEHPRVGVMYNDDDEDVMPNTLENDSEFVEHFLPRSVFTGVQQLTIFIEDIWDEDEEECHLHYVDLRGEFTELTKDPVITIYELAPNPADHKNLTATEATNFFLGN